MDFLYQLDVTIFYFINDTLSNPAFDKIFPFLTEPKNWLITYFILFLLLLIKGGRLGRIAAVMLALLITASDQISSSLLKSLFERVRPCNVLEHVNILVTCTESFSFPSSHAVNNFAAALFFTMIFPKYRFWFFTVAVLQAFSRPYVGVHYPSDVVAGALIGSALGYFFGWLTLKINSFFTEKKTHITDKYQRIEFK
ncbi:MAG: Membrane-associated phospholipid phosphatase [Ignavibacteria bacterium]|nr:MAG: Membrane-associated phospholipid phosphatase [Ignavibacteria bacterium]KAF0161861.1 MAG: Membrane-associated phospholipid phosphatase [Ignavibacteria bacterium]